VDVFIKVRSSAWPKIYAVSSPPLSQQNRQLDTENPVPQWQIGEGGVQPHEIVIVGAIQASSTSYGSWMPILQLTRYMHTQTLIDHTQTTLIDHMMLLVV